ncbi:hypothetical protein ACFLYD_00200 [Chloroflexota bacterium]
MASASPSYGQSFSLRLSAPQVIALWGTLAIVICSFLAISVFSRTDLPGWDTPTYVFRARLVERYGIGMHAQIGGGFQIAFPLLSLAAHRLTGLDYIDIVRLLPALLMTLICLAAGYFAHILVKSQLLAMLTALFTLAWGLSPHLVIDARDNAAVMLFGLLSLICLAKSRPKNAWLSELSQCILLILAGVSHLALSSVFFVTTFLVNLIDFHDDHWFGEREQLIFRLWKAVRVPLLAGLVVGAVWIPALVGFVNSLGFGLRTMAELSGVRDNTLLWVISRYGLAPSLPWILLGLTAVTWVVYAQECSRGFKVVFVWSFICIYYGIVLQPISFLYGRFLMMAPLYLLIPLGIGYIWQITQSWGGWHQATARTGVLIAALGMLLPTTLSFNAKVLAEIPGVPVAAYARLRYVNQYVESHRPPVPFVFLVEDTSIYAEAYTDVWRRVVRSVIHDEALTETYIYFGTLEHLMRKELTPPSALGLSESGSDFITDAGRRWFSILEEDRVLDHQQMTVFIIEAFNRDTFEEYSFSPMVDEISSGILVVKNPKGLQNQVDGTSRPEP